MKSADFTNYTWYWNSLIQPDLLWGKCTFLQLMPCIIHHFSIPPDSQYCWMDKSGTEWVPCTTTGSVNQTLESEWWSAGHQSKHWLCLTWRNFSHLTGASYNQNFWTHGKEIQLAIIILMPQIIWVQRWILVKLWLYHFVHTCIPMMFKWIFKCNLNVFMQWGNSFSLLLSFDCKWCSY